MADELRLAAVGDVVLTRPPGTGLLLEPLRKADVRLANLEGPITGRGAPADKLINLRMPPGAGDWVRELGMEVVSLANNHAMDYGPQGLKDTLAELEGAGIVYAGAGGDLEASLRPAMVELRGVRVAVVCLAATVPPGFAAGWSRPGIAPLRIRVSYSCDGAIAEEQPGTPPWVHSQVVDEDLAAAVEAVARTRETADIVVVQMHWGVPPEWNSPFQGELAEYQRPLAHAVMDAGAHVILGHHPHAPQGVEAYRDGLIFYSLGNFIFHPYTDRDALVLQRPAPPYRPVHTDRNRESLVVSLTFSPSSGGWGLQEAELVPGVLNAASEAHGVDPKTAEGILDRVARSGATVGINLEMEEGRAVVRPD